MTDVFKKTAVVLLLLLAFFAAGFSARKNVYVEIITEKGNSVYTVTENKSTKNFGEKIFGVNYVRRAEKLKEAGKTDREILDYLFVGFTHSLDLLCDNERIDAVDATAKFFPNRAVKFIYTEGRAGKEIIKENLFADVVRALSEKNISVKAKYRAVQPEVSKSELITNTVRRGGFKTYYGHSSAARKDNIERAVSHINGVEIASGDIFSFNKTVGARTAARGYKEAPIIVNGKFEGGVGGGVCQVSTTLYNSVLYSDLAVVTVSRHSLPVRYVMPSFDAMVSSVSDFRFSNNTDYSTYIEGKCEGGYVYFTLYGAPREYDITLVSEKIKDVAFSTEYIDDDTLDEGVESVVNEGSNGLVSEGFIVRSKGGAIISRVKIRHDVYGAVGRTVLRGTRRTTELPDIH